MIGFVVRSGDHFKTWESGWTSDVLAAWRFAREEDAQKFIPFDVTDEYVVPVLMSPQYPRELQEVRDAILEAQRAYWHAENTQGDWFVRRRLRRRASMTRHHAESLCYELFRRSILREPVRELPKVAK